MPLALSSPRTPCSLPASDLSRLHYDAVTYFDQGFENLIAEYKLGALIDYMINDGEPRACGDMAIITTLMTAQARRQHHPRPPPYQFRGTSPALPSRDDAPSAIWQRASTKH